MLMIILAAAAVGAAQPDPAPEAAPKPVSSVTVEAKKKEKQVCYEETVTGSHRTQKVCRVKGAMDTQDNLLRDRIRDRPQGDIGGIGGVAR